MPRGSTEQAAQLNTSVTGMAFRLTARGTQAAGEEAARAAGLGTKSEESG